MAGETGLEPATLGFGVPFYKKYRELLNGTEQSRKTLKPRAKKEKSRVRELSQRNQKKSQK